MNIINTHEIDKKILSVSQLNLQARSLIEGKMASVYVEGEISNLAKPPSGHIYFSLKDQHAQIRCAYFKRGYRQPTAELKNGQSVIINAKASIYEARGDYQLIVSEITLSGAGTLHLQFEALKKKLAAEGLFDPKAKKDIPVFPKNIGVITSPSGAAIKDILTVLGRRYPLASIIIYPTLVQGEQAKETIALSLQQAQRRNECDLLILARGGGSIEDLWPFNEEVVARAIAQTTIPIISGVGHETDITIADFVADMRAPTPSAAAECATPDINDLVKNNLHYFEQLKKIINNIITQKNNLLNQTKQQLHHPQHRIDNYKQKLDEATLRLQHIISNILLKKSSALEAHHSKLSLNNPQIKLHRAKEQLHHAKADLINKLNVLLTQKKQQLNMSASLLDANSPLKILDQGYAIVSSQSNDTIIKKAEQCSIDNAITIQLASGMLEAIISKVIK